MLFVFLLDEWKTKICAYSYWLFVKTGTQLSTNPASPHATHSIWRMQCLTMDSNQVRNLQHRNYSYFLCVKTGTRLSINPTNPLATHLIFGMKCLMMASSQVRYGVGTTIAAASATTASTTTASATAFVEQC